MRRLRDTRRPATFFPPRFLPTSNLCRFSRSTETGWTREGGKVKKEKSDIKYAYFDTGDKVCSSDFYDFYENAGSDGPQGRSCTGLVAETGLVHKRVEHF